MKEFIFPVSEEDYGEDYKWISEHNNGELVRCKDCKHRPVKPNDYKNGFDLAFPDYKCHCQCEDGWYSWYPGDDWFCADGERRTDDA